MSRILIVDDMKENRYMLDVLLSSNGHTVDTAHNGQEALDHALSEPPDLIISDILMPVMDGFRLCREWKAHEKLAGIPFVFYTATYTEDKDEQFALSLGADRFLRKPLEPMIFLKAIREVIEAYETGNAEATRKPTASENTLMKEYNETLVRKLEQKMLRLEEEIQQRKEVERKLRVSEERLRLATALGKVGVFDYKHNGTTILAPFLSTMLGHSDMDRGMSLEEFSRIIHPEDRELFLKAFNPLPSSDSGQFEHLCRLIGADNTVYWFQFRGSVQRLEQEDIMRLVGIAIDVTKERKTQEESIMLAHALKNVNEYVCITDRSGHILYANDAMCLNLGKERSVLSGTSIKNLFADPQLVENIGKATVQFISPGQQLETWIKHRDGSTIPVLLSVSHSPETGYSAWVCVNISEKREKERQLRLSQKMETIGTLASGIAHDFNNLLCAIVGYTELCQAQIERDSQVGRNLQQIRNASERGQALTRQILTYCRMGETEKQAIDLEPIVSEVHKLIRATLPASVDIRVDNRARNTVVMADAGQMHQILMNLCTNAGNAMMNDGGVLSILLDEAELTAQDIPAHEKMLPGKYLKLVVSDTGCGIQPEDLDRIFDPFFSTREMGEGTGLGLSVTQGIVLNHGGTIRVESHPGKGSTFTVLLPSTGIRLTETEEERESLVSGTGTIIVLDDEEMLTEVLSLFLSELGYTVIPFNEGRAVLEFLKDENNKADLLITDMTMPGMNGIQLADRVHRLRPDMPIMLASGNPGQVNRNRMEDAGICCLLGKPYTHGQLSRMIHDALQT